MATGRSTAADPEALIAELEVAHEAVRVALQRLYDHDHVWPFTPEQKEVAAYHASRCAEFGHSLQIILMGLQDADFEGLARPI